MQKLRKAIQKAIKYKALGMLSCYNLEVRKIDRYKAAAKSETERQDKQKDIRCLCWHTLQDM